MGLLSMRRSKLEMHIDILKALARHGPLRVTHVMRKVNINCGRLKQYLDLLIKHNLVEVQTSHKRRSKPNVYAITEEGRILLACFREVDVALQVTAEANKTRATLF